MGVALARMHHGDYVAELVYEKSAGLFRGRVINPGRERLYFWGGSLKELRVEFARSVKAYEESYCEAGQEPERPRAVRE
jgi:predicted HicB family RNase H-like nuclease